MKNMRSDRMKGKHIHIESDSQLLAKIQQRVSSELNLEGQSYRSKLILKLVFYGGFSVALYVTMFIVSHPALFILNYVLLGMTLLLFAFNFAHDLSHNTIFDDKKWNNWGFIALYTMVGAHAQAWRERHVNSHHFAPNVKEYDTDLQITNLIRVTPDMEYNWFHRYQFIYAPIAYATYSLYWIFIKDFKLLFDKIGKRESSAGYVISFVVQKVFYLSFMLGTPIVFTDFSIWVVLLGFLAMHLIQSVFLLFTFFMTHHVVTTTYPETDEDGIIQSSWLMNQIGSSNDMHPFSETANFFLGGFNNHIAHHLFPNIHHIHYPNLNKILYDTLIEHGITPNQTSYIGGAISHLKLLRELSKPGTRIHAVQ